MKRFDPVRRIIGMAAGLGLAGALVLSLPPACAAQANERLLANHEAQQRIEDELNRLTARLDSERSKLARTEQLYKAGQANAADLIEGQRNIDELRIAVEQAKRNAQAQSRLVELTKPINVELKDATVAQAGQAIAKASGIEVHVGSAVSSDSRLSLIATAAPLAAVLESVATQLDLMISPLVSGGVDLDVWPTVEVNGTKQRFTDPTKPWASGWLSLGDSSDPAGRTSAVLGGMYGGFGLNSNAPKWPMVLGMHSGQQVIGGYGAGNNPIGNSGGQAAGGGNFSSGVKSPGGYNGLGGQGGQGTTKTNGSSGGSGFYPSQNTNRNTMQANTALDGNRSYFGGQSNNSLSQILSGSGYSAGGFLQGVNITSVGNRVVVAEPGRGPKGEAGAWLTVYMLQGNQLVKVSSLFHPTHATLVSPSDLYNNFQQVQPSQASPDANQSNSGKRRQ